MESNRKISHQYGKDIKTNAGFKPDNIKVKNHCLTQGLGWKAFCIVRYLTTNIPTKGGKHLKVCCMLSPKVVKLIREMCRLLIHLIICYYRKCKTPLLGLLPEGLLVDASPLSLRGLIIVNDFIDPWFGSASYAPVNQAINSC